MALLRILDSVQNTQIIKLQTSENWRTVTKINQKLESRYVQPDDRDYNDDNGDDDYHDCDHDDDDDEETGK